MRLGSALPACAAALGLSLLASPAVQASTIAPAGEPPVASDAGDAPKDAAGFGARGEAFAIRRDYARAIADLSRAIELEPGDPQLLLDRAKARAGAGQRDLALADLDKALELKPDDLPALVLRGELRLAGDDLAGARADFDAAVRVSGDARFPIASAYLKAHRFQPAIEELDAWLDAHPRDPGRADGLRGRCLVRALWGRELDKALADCDAALDLKSYGELWQYEAEIHDIRGFVHMRLGQLDAAIADFDAAMARPPQRPSSLYCRGVAETRKGLKDAGQADIKAATALVPKIADVAKTCGLRPGAP